MTVEDHDADDFDTIIDDDDRDDDDSEPTKEELARMQRALTKANSEAKKNRLRYKQLLAKTVDGKSTDGDGKEDKNKEIDRERIRNEVSEAEEARWKKRVVRQAAKAALLEAGLTGDATKMARLVDEDDVDVDDDGEISDGLEEQIESIKEDYPDLFEDKNAPPPRTTRRTRIDGGSRERPPQRKLTSAEKIQQQVMKTNTRRR